MAEQEEKSLPKWKCPKGHEELVIKDLAENFEAIVKCTTCGAISDLFYSRRGPWREKEQV